MCVCVCVILICVYILQIRVHVSYICIHTYPYSDIESYRDCNWSLHLQNPWLSIPSKHPVVPWRLAVELRGILKKPNHLKSNGYEWMFVNQSDIE